jgi:hypothetical protein
MKFKRLLLAERKAGVVLGGEEQKGNKPNEKRRGKKSIVGVNQKTHPNY